MSHLFNKHFIKGFFTLVLSCICLCSYCYEVQVNGWTVDISNNLRIRSISKGDRVLLKNFHWKMQAKEGDKVINPGGQGKLDNPVKRQTKGLFETSNNKFKDILLWGEKLSFDRNSIQLSYDFEFQKSVKDSWFMMYCHIPDVEHSLCEKAADLKEQINYTTKSGNLFFIYSPKQSYLEPHRPYLKKAFRLFLGAHVKQRIKRNFQQGDSYTVDIKIILPPAPVEIASPTPQSTATSLADLVKIGFAKKVKGDNWLYNPGEKVVFDVALTGGENIKEKVKTTWTLTDYFDKKVFEKSELLFLPENSIPLELTVPKRFGPYRLTLKISRIMPSGQTETLSKDVAVFGVKNPLWSKKTVSDQEKCFLGAVIHGDQGKYKLSHDLGIRWKRCEFEVIWMLNSREPKKYKFRKNSVNSLRECGIQGVGQLAYCPYYAVEATEEEKAKYKNSSNVHNPLTARPPKMEFFKDYVRNAVNTFKDDFKYWELWNEPNVPIFWQGSFEQYMAMLKATYKILKEIRPDAKLMAPGGGGMVGLDPWGKKVLEMGAAKHLDIWSFHQYSHDPYFYADDVHKKIQQLKQVLQDNGGGHLELWNTEGGGGGHTMYRDAELKSWPLVETRSERNPLIGFSLPKMFTVEMAEGVKKHFVYFLKGNGRYAGHDYLEFNKAAGYMLYPAAAWKGIVDGADFIERKTKDDLANLYLFKRDKNAIAMLWADIPIEDAIPLPCKRKDLKCYDALGNEISANEDWPLSVAPIYIVGNNMSPDRLSERINLNRLTTIKNPELIAQRNKDPELGLPIISDFQIVKELGPKNLKPIDISSFCNMSYYDDVPGDRKGGWSDEGPFNDFKGIKTGLVNIYGAPFQIIDPSKNNDKAVIALKAAKSPWGIEEVEIPINSKDKGFWRGLFILHANQNYTEKGLAYTLTFNYANGKKESVKITVPEHLSGTWIKPNPEIEEPNRTKAVLMKVGTNRLMRKDEKKWAEKHDYIYRYPRVTYLENPKPYYGKLKSVTITTGNPEGGVPMIMGLTLGQ